MASAALLLLQPSYSARYSPELKIRGTHGTKGTRTSKEEGLPFTHTLPIDQSKVPRWGRSQGWDTFPSQVSPLTQSPATSTPPPEDVDMSDPADPIPRESSVTSIESQQLLPRVLVSVALEQEQILRTEDWIEWLRSFPALAK